MRVRKKWPGTKIVSMLNDADFYSNFIPTHQRGTQQFLVFLRDLNSRLCPSMVDGSSHHCFGGEMDVKAETWGEQRRSLFHAGSVQGLPGPLSRSGLSWRSPCTAQEQSSLKHTPAVGLYHVLTVFLCALSKPCLENLCCSLWDGLFCILTPFWSHGAARIILFTKSE